MSIKLLSIQTFKGLLAIIISFILTNSLLIPAYADISPSAPYPDSTVSGLSAQIGGVELSTASTNIANFSDIVGAYYDSTLKRIVFIGKTSGSPKYNQDDMAVAIKSIFINNVMPNVSIDNDPGNPTGPNAVVTYTSGLQNTNLGSVLFNADYKYKQYAIGYTSTGSAVISSVSSYKSVVNRYLALTGSPIAGNESKYILSPQFANLKTATSSGAVVFTNVAMQATAQPVNMSNDSIWNTAANNFASDITANYDQYATETPYFAQVKMLSKMISTLKWISDYGIDSDYHSLQFYTPQFVSTPTTATKAATPTGYSAKGEINYNTPNTYIPDDGTASGMKTSAQSGSSSKEDITWTFTNNGQTYQAVAVSAEAFKSLGAYSTSVTDISVPIAGDLVLGLKRSYNSFSSAQLGLGIGWDYMPARLNFNSESFDLTICGSNVYITKLAIDTPYGHETYTYDCTNHYVADNSSFHSKLVQNGDGTYTVTLANQIKFNFNANFKLTSHVDREGNVINYSYDGSGRLSTIADTHSHTLTLAYNAQDLISSVTDWTSRQIQYGYTSGRLTSVTDPKNNTTTYGYDSNSKLTTISDRNNQQILANSFNSDARMASQTTAASLSATFSYDNINKVITKTDTNGRISKITYDSNSRVLQDTDPYNKSTVYTYGTESTPLTVKDKNNNTTTYTYDSNGNLLTITYPDSSVVTYTYDSSNRLLTISDARYSPSRTTTYTYNTNGTLATQQIATQSASFTYDTTGEMLTKTDTLSHITTWTRDSLGNPSTEKDAYNKTKTNTFDSLGRLTKIQDANSKYTYLTYDANGNVLTASDSAGIYSNTYDKENNLTLVTYPNSTTVQYTYNRSGDMLTATDQLNNTTTYGYNSYQSLTSTQDPLSHTTTSSFDNMNRQTQFTTHLGKVTSVQYDDNSNITQRTDAKSQTTSYQYDSLNRLKKITYPDATTINYTYDARGNLVTMVDPNGTSTYNYDIYDHMFRASDSYGQVIQYTYNSEGKLTQLKYPDGKNVYDTYDNDNRLSTITDWAGKTTSYTYNDNGTLATRVYPNSITTYYTYDNANRITTLEYKNGSTSNVKFINTLNSLGNITISTQSGSFFGGSQTNLYTYDNANRLTYALLGPATRYYNYTYDKVGNKLTEVSYVNNITNTYDADNRLIDINGNSRGYDNNGNLATPSATTLYQYNYENKFTTISGTLKYKYDGLGNRITDGYPYSFAIDISQEQPNPLTAYDIGLSKIRRYFIYANKDMTPTIMEYNTGGTTVIPLYSITDISGNVIFYTSSTGSVYHSFTYEPYGNIRSSSGLSSAVPTFAGQLYVEEYYPYTHMRARFYDSGSSQFTTKDPKAGSIGLPITQNPYVYANDDPINNDDPTGLSSTSQIFLNRTSGRAFEDTVLKLYEYTKNTIDLRRFGFGRFIPDILESGEIGEIKSGKYLYLSPQLRAFGEYSKVNGRNFTLYVRDGYRMSAPLRDWIELNGFRVIQVIKTIPPP